MASKFSYYFTLFKKFQVIDHVPTQMRHGNPMAPSGGFNLNDPNAPFTGSNSGTPLTLGDFAPMNNPLFAILKSRLSNAGHFPVTIQAGAQAQTQWPTMPVMLTTYWTEFQVTPPVGEKLLDAFEHWISVDTQTKDTPTGVIATKPPSFAGPDDMVVSPFVCSTPTDQGARPAVLPNFWATSLIFLVDPDSGATVPGTFVAGAEYYLTAVIGNRGLDGGRALNKPEALQAAASVMVWNTFASPGVQLPSLSNLTLSGPNAKNGIYEQYFLRSGQYDVIGFRLNVQTVFNGIVAALNDAVTNDGLDLGGVTPAEWVHNDPAHLCAKVVIRLQGTSFSNLETSPEVDARIAQKNLAPFEMSIVSTDPNPNITWRNFLVGQPLFFLLNGAGKNNLLLRTVKLPRDVFQLYLAMPKRSFERFVRDTQGKIKGFKLVNPEAFLKRPQGRKALPFPDEAVILRATDEEPSLQFGPMNEGQFGAMSLGIEYIPAKLTHGTFGDITIAQESMVPRLDRDSGCYKVERAVVGGFTLQLRVNDPNVDRKGNRIEI